MLPRSNEVAVCSPTECTLQELAEFFSRRRFPLMPEAYGWRSEWITAHLSTELQNAQEGELLILRRAPELEGVARLVRARFDEEVYGIRMAKLVWFLASGDAAAQSVVHRGLLAATLQVALHAGVRHIACQLPTDDVAGRHALEAAGFRLMDTSLEFRWSPQMTAVEETEHSWTVEFEAGHGPAPGVRIAKLGARIRPFESPDLPELREIAAESFTRRTIAHYAADPDLSISATARLYERWVENACAGGFGDHVAVAELGGRVRGFQAIRLERQLSEQVGASIAAMGIGAVAADSRARAAFPMVLAATLRWCRREGVQFARGRVLVNNLAMHTPCLALGGRVVASYHTFHRTMA